MVEAQGKRMPNDARNGTSGQFVEKYPREAFLRAIAEADPVAGTGEVANVVGCEHDTAYKRLHRLLDEGVVGKRKVGNMLLWSLTDEGETARSSEASV